MTFIKLTFKNISFHDYLMRLQTRISGVNWQFMPGENLALSGDLQEEEYFKLLFRKCILFGLIRLYIFKSRVVFDRPIP